MRVSEVISIDELVCYIRDISEWSPSVFIWRAVAEVDEVVKSLANLARVQDRVDLCGSIVLRIQFE